MVINKKIKVYIKICEEIYSGNLDTHLGTSPVRTLGVVTDLTVGLEANEVREVTALLGVTSHLGLVSSSLVSGHNHKVTIFVKK